MLLGFNSDIFFLSENRIFQYSFLKKSITTFLHFNKDQLITGFALDQFK
jgi:hypothetical protein